MPPALSDSESEPEIILPSRSRRRNSDEISESGRIRRTSSDGLPRNGASVNDNDESDGGDDEDDEGDEKLGDGFYVVEAIKKHRMDSNGVLEFFVKWAGWNKKDDLTWEPEENLAESAAQILEGYFERNGGRAKIIAENRVAKTKKRGRAAAKAGSETKRSRKSDTHPAKSEMPKSAKDRNWTPPAGSWEDEIESIDAYEDATTHKLVVYLNWKNGNKTKHDTHVIYKKCPQKMLQFYERHVKIVRDDNNVLVDEV